MKLLVFFPKKSVAAIIHNYDFFSSDSRKTMNTNFMLCIYNNENVKAAEERDAGFISGKAANQMNQGPRVYTSGS